MAATGVPAKRQGGYDTVITVTNGLTYVTLSLPAIIDEGEEVRPATSIHLTAQQGDKLVDTLINKIVNVNRSVRDNEPGAL